MLKQILIFSFLLFYTYKLQAQKMKIYSDNKTGITINYPLNWEYQQNMRTIFIFMRPLEVQGQIFRENINLIINSAKNLSLQEYAGAAKVQFSSQLPGYKEFSTNYLEINGNKYARIIYEHKTNNLPLKVAYYITIKKDKAYCITCSATDVTFNKYYSVFEQMMQSFKITK